MPGDDAGGAESVQALALDQGVSVGVVHGARGAVLEAVQPVLFQLAVCAGDDDGVGVVGAGAGDASLKRAMGALGESG